MTGYFYTIGLGETYGPKLERLAERARSAVSACTRQRAITG